jgi:hypothetical protein
MLALNYYAHYPLILNRCFLPKKDKWRDWIRMERSQILSETAKLFDENCKGCKKWTEAAKQKHHKKAQEYCERQCEIGKRLLELGDYLTYGHPSKVARDLIKEVYQEERDAGLLDKDIIQKYKISAKVLWLRKKFWGLSIDQSSKMDLISKDQYLQWKDEGLSDEYIAKKVGIFITTLKRYKNRWGIKHSAADINAIKEGPNGEEISAHTYLAYKDKDWTDDQILEHWLIGRTTLQRKKRAWRMAGYEIDKYNSHKIPSTVIRRAIDG